MEIRKLDTWQEWLESDRIVGTAFLHKWNEKEAAEKFQAQAEGKQPRNEDAWGLFNDSGKMAASIITLPRRLSFDGQIIPAGDVNMVASLPEERGGGNIRALMKAVLSDFKQRGDVFAVLHPFSFAFYRKFGFELASRVLSQKVPIGQLAGFRCEYAVKRVDGENDIPVLRRLYENDILTKNLADAKENKDWQYRGNGEFGEPDFWHGDSTQYTYTFSDSDGIARAYLKFLFAPGPEGPFTGTMEVTELVYDSPEAFRNVLGFVYGMRAKITDVSMELLDDVDLSTILPECDKVERKLGGHVMARVLDVEKVLRLMKHPKGNGNYVIHVEDAFLPENTGTYAVSFADGKALTVERTDSLADLEETEETFCQLAVGLITPAEAEYREGTRINGNRETLERVFVKKTVCAR